MSYSNEAKVRLLGVPAGLIDPWCGVTGGRASHGRRGASRAQADVGIGITGVAGPDGGTPTKPVGFVCLCVTTSSGIVLARDLRLPGNRADVRDRSVDAGMHLLLRGPVRARVVAPVAVAAS